MGKDIIVKHVKVDRSRTPQTMLKEAVNWESRFSLSDEIVGTMPKGEGDEVEVIFFKPDHFVSNVYDLEKEYELHDLRAVDPYSLMAINDADPTFASKYPSGTQWKDNNGRW